MARARKAMELAVHIGDRPGELARLWSVISAQQINILAYCAYRERNEGCVRLVTEDALKAQQALEAAGYRCAADPVVVVNAPDHIGAAASLGHHLGRAGVNILYSYASSTGADFYAIFKTDNDDVAVELLASLTTGCPTAPGPAGS